QGLRIFQHGPDRSHDCDLKAIEDPCHAECGDHEQVETAQRKPIKPRWDASINPLTASGGAWLRRCRTVRVPRHGVTREMLLNPPDVWWFCRLELDNATPH